MVIADCQIISLPKIIDDRGNLSFIEAEKHIPLLIKRVYWVYDVPGGEIRGGHAYKTSREFFIALSGSFDVVLDDGINKKTCTLNRSYFGLYVPNMIWRHIENFSTNSVCMVLASSHYSAEDYIRDYAIFTNKVKK
jgi:dTDP-4-dehydrorhamnose 3,5-epimerase-like enzyme